jgi:hypothetical protein
MLLENPLSNVRAQPAVAADDIFLIFVQFRQPFPQTIEWNMKGIWESTR